MAKVRGTDMPLLPHSSLNKNLIAGILYKILGLPQALLTGDPFSLRPMMNKRIMHRTGMLALAFLMSHVSFSQDVATLMAEGQKFEQQLKDTLAIGKYAKALVLQPDNLKAAIKCAEMSISIGSRQTKEEDKKRYFYDAENFANAAIKLGPEDANANYMMAVVSGKLTEVESSNQKTVEYVKNIKTYADKALSIDPKFGKAWYVIGKWHYEVLNLNAIKRAAVKLFYGGLPKANIDTAIAAFEKCRTLEPYFAMNHLGLAKAYNYNKEYEKALASLQQCVKCPTLSPGDRDVKNEAKDLIVKWQ